MESYGGSNCEGVAGERGLPVKKGGKEGVEGASFN